MGGEREGEGSRVRRTARRDRDCTPPSLVGSAFWAVLWVMAVGFIGPGKRHDYNNSVGRSKRPG